MWKKIIKLVNNPGLFIRDFLIKKIPIVLNQHGIAIENEQEIIKINSEFNEVIENDLEVDIVYTWVDDTDELWSLKKEKFINNTCYQINRLATDTARFSNHNELKYSIASINKHMRWVRNIYVVTDNQKPQWLVDCEKVKVVDHKDIIESKYLPTFNSHVIESSLHKIKGLSENFIYFNDDVFVARKLSKSHFFKSNGVSSIFLNKNHMKKSKIKMNTPTADAISNCKRLMMRTYNFDVSVELVHTYVPLKKKYMNLAWSLYNSDVDKFMWNKFRSEIDLNIATYMAPWLSYINGDSFPVIDICHYFNIRSKSADLNCKMLKEMKVNNCEPHSFCANDFLCNGNKSYKARLVDVLEEYFR